MAPPRWPHVRWPLLLKTIKLGRLCASIRNWQIDAISTHPGDIVQLVIDVKTLGDSNEPSSGSDFTLISPKTIYSSALRTAINSQACHAPRSLARVQCAGSYSGT